MCRFSRPTCETRAGGLILTTAVPERPKYFESKESDSGTSTVIVFPEIAAMRRSAVVVLPADELDRRSGCFSCVAAAAQHDAARGDRERIRAIEDSGCQQHRASEPTLHFQCGHFIDGALEGLRVVAAT